MGIVINKPCELDLRALLKKLNLGSQDSQKVWRFQNQYIMGVLYNRTEALFCMSQLVRGHQL